jgi:hypothetical protein
MGVTKPGVGALRVGNTFPKVSGTSMCVKAKNFSLVGNHPTTKVVVPSAIHSTEKLMVILRKN